MTRKNWEDDDWERRGVSRCIRMVRGVFKVCRRQCVPLCSSKFSRRDFTQWHEEAAEGVRTRTRRFLKLTVGAELRRQPVASVSVRRGPRNDTIDFSPVARKARSIRPVGVGIGDEGYDSERSHVLLREELHAMSMIPPRMERVPLWRTEGLYRKEMKRRFSERVYHQRSKDETTFSVVKRTMGDEMRSVRVKGLNNEIRLRMIAYNAMRVASSCVRVFLQSRMC